MFKVINWGKEKSDKKIRNGFIIICLLVIILVLLLPSRKTPVSADMPIVYTTTDEAIARGVPAVTVAPVVVYELVKSNGQRVFFNEREFSAITKATSQEDKIFVIVRKGDDYYEIDRKNLAAE